MNFDLVEILPVIGYFGIFAIIFAECGLFFGFFLPGDSLLFTAGFLASSGIFNIWILTIGCFVAAVFGNIVGYSFGKSVGKRLFSRHDSLLFHHDHLERAKRFYEAHGKKTIILARFLPIVRTFATIVAGIGEMDYPTFIIFNIIGALVWAVGLTAGGYFLGSLVPDVDKYLIPIVLIIIVASILPTAIHILKDEEYRKHIIKLLRKILRYS